MPNPTRTGSISNGKVGATPQTDLSYSHTSDSSTTLVVVAIAIWADESSKIEDVLFDSTSMELIMDTISSGLAGDMYTAVYGIVGKASTTANVVIDTGVATFERVASAAVNIKDTSAASVAAAARGLIQESGDTTGSSITVQSTGESTRTMVAVGGIYGNDTAPFGYSGSFTRIDLDSGAGDDEVISDATNLAAVLGWGELTAGGPAAVVITPAVSDERTIVVFELLSIGDAIDVEVGPTRTVERVADSTTSVSDEDVAHVVDANTTLLVVDVWTAGNETEDANLSITWDQPGVDEALTRVHLPTRTSKTSGDPHVQTWAILNPTAKAADIQFLLSSGTMENVVIHATNYRGTSVASLGAAITFLDDDVNLVDTDTCDIASDGTAGSLLHAVCAFRGLDTDPLDFSAGWASLRYEYGTTGSANWASHAVSKEGPSAVSWDAQGSDPDENNMGVMFEISPPAAAAGNPWNHYAQQQ